MSHTGELERKLPTHGNTASAVLLVLMMSVPLLVLSGAGSVRSAEGQPMGGKAYGGPPSVAAIERQAFAFVGREYHINATSTMPDDGSVSWSLETNASWISVVTGGDGWAFCNLSGVPGARGTYYVNLTVSDLNSYDYRNFTVDVREPGVWGYVETLGDIPTGTHDPVNITLASGLLRLINASAQEESLVLDGSLYLLSRQSLANATVASYEPAPVDDGLGWNLTVTMFPTRDESAFKGLGRPISEIGVSVYLCSGNATIAGVFFDVGNSTLGHERVLLYDGIVENWSEFAEDIIPAYPNRRAEQVDRPDLSESLYGFDPDGYTLSFGYSVGDDFVSVYLHHTSTGYIARAKVPVSGPAMSDVQLRFVTTTDLQASGQYFQCGYWVVDDIGYRGLMSTWPVIGPQYEYIFKGGKAWVSVKDLDGRSIEGAAVRISGVPAVFDPESRRFEADTSLGVGWAERVNYTVDVGGCRVSDSMLVTVMPYLNGTKVSIPLWWNGWDWVTVFGRDDSTYATTAADTYWEFSHPTTSYILNPAPTGSSEDILATQSEIGMHYPHDYSEWPTRFWDRAVSAAELGHAILENRYAFASRWDDSRYVGKGDTYISMATPGNSASWAQVYAHYARGTRILGFASNPYNGAPGNASLMGSWWASTYRAEGTGWAAPGSQWYPFSPMDLMDAARGPNTDYELPEGEWNLTFWVAEHGGVRRVYNHGVISPSAAVLLAWMCDPKTNFSFENWKATDGEVASYVYGRWSTDVQMDFGMSNSTVLTYFVSRRDPTADGYWRVPVTLAFNISGRILADITIAEGNRTLSLAGGSLQNLNGKRVMDVGYDIRAGTAYVSYFWNGSSVVSLRFSDEAPIPNTPPIASFTVDAHSGNVSKVFLFDASYSSDSQDPPSALLFRWDWNGDGSWDTEWLSSPVATHQFSVPGTYLVRLQVMDRGSLVGEAEAVVQVSDLEIPEFPMVALVVLSTLSVFALVAHTRRGSRDRHS